MTKAANLAALGTSSGASVLVQGTAVNSTSGTSIDFTGIPSWVKRVTVMFTGVSTNGSSIVQLQLGSGSVTTTGYNAVSSYGTSAGQYISGSTGFFMEPTGVAGAGSVRYGSIVFTLLSANIWVSQGCLLNTASGATVATSGQISLAGTLDRVRITTVNGTDTFDAGQINILYE